MLKRTLRKSAKQYTTEKTTRTPTTQRLLVPCAHTLWDAP